MKKYKTSIEVTGDNAKALFDCPIVTDIKKATDAAADGLDVGDMLAQVTILTANNTHVSVKRGNVLVQDICGHWEVMTAEDWESHKDDTISEDGDATDGDTDKPSDGSDSTGDGGLLDQ